MLDLENVEALMGKISNNIEIHGDQEVKAYDIPLTLLVPPAQLVGLLGTYCDRTLFNTKGDIQEPAELFKHTSMPLNFEDDLRAAELVLVLSGDVHYEFEKCPISKIRFEPKLGGLVELNFSVRVHPGDEKQSWLLLEHQHRHVRLTIANSAIALKKNPKQSELPLEQPAAGYDQRHTIENGSGEKVELRSGAEIDQELLARNPGAPTMGAAAKGSSADPEFEAAAKEQVAAFKRGRRARSTEKGAH